MDKYGDWVYYLIFLAITIVSLLKNADRKKRREAEEMTLPPPVPQMQAPPPPPAPMMDRRKRAVTAPPPAPGRARKEKTYPSFGTDEGVRILASGQSETMELTDLKEATYADGLSLTDTDTLRKAIIYAEILERKY
ncbi:MAG: hypothetical protein LBR49_07600 [Tannerella sp.]|jgi:hypothetical protein|nr:hypothetical protein [Tannerella sp.]